MLLGVQWYTFPLIDTCHSDCIARQSPKFRLLSLILWRLELTNRIHTGIWTASYFYRPFEKGTRPLVLFCLIYTFFFWLLTPSKIMPFLTPALQPGSTLSDLSTFFNTQRQNLAISFPPGTHLANVTNADSTRSILINGPWLCRTRTLRFALPLRIPSPVRKQGHYTLSIGGR